MRTLDSGDSRRLEGTEDAAKPFWAPDAQNLGFFANGKLKRIGVDANAPQTLANVGLSPAGGTWARGVILFAAWKSGLRSIPEAGGPVTIVTTPNHAALETAHGSPQFLPDGRHFLYAREPGSRTRGNLCRLARRPDKLRVADGAVTYVPPGYFVFVRDGMVSAQPFDASRLTTTGPATGIAGNAPANAVVSASDAGLLTFGGLSSGSKLVWLSRTGQVLGAIEDARASPQPRVLARSETADREQQRLGSARRLAGRPGARRSHPRHAVRQSLGVTRWPPHHLHLRSCGRRR